MPCAVCLEDFSDVDAPIGRAPHALPCGHIFHGECVEKWHQHCREAMTGLNCPHCKTVCVSARSVFRLFPSEAHDLDGHLSRHAAKRAIQRMMRQEQEEIDGDSGGNSSQGSRQGEMIIQRIRRKKGAAASIGGVITIEGEEIPLDEMHKGEIPDEEDHTLLSNLIDFERSLKAFVIGAHGLRLQPMRKANAQIYQFIEENLTPAQQSEEIRTCITAVDTAVSQLDAVRYEMIRRSHLYEKVLKEYEGKKMKLQKKFSEMEQERKKMAMEKEQLRKRAQDASDFESRMAMQSKKLDERERSLETRETQIRQEIREMALKMSKVRQEAKDSVTRMQMEKDEFEAAKMEEVMQYHQDKEAAEAERDAVRLKNFDLANSMRGGQEKMDRLRTQKNKLTKELEEARREIEQRAIAAKAAAKSSPEQTAAADFPSRLHTSGRTNVFSDALGEISNVSIPESSRRGRSSSASEEEPSSSGMKRQRTLGRHLNGGFGDSSRSISFRESDQSLMIEAPDYSMVNDAYLMPGGLRPKARPLPMPTAPRAPSKQSSAPMPAKKTAAPRPVEAPQRIAPATPSRKRAVPQEQQQQQLPQFPPSPKKSPERRPWNSPYKASGRSSPSKATVSPVRHIQCAGAQGGLLFGSDSEDEGYDSDFHKPAHPPPPRRPIAEQTHQQLTSRPKKPTVAPSASASSMPTMATGGGSSSSRVAQTRLDFSRTRSDPVPKKGRAGASNEIDRLMSAALGGTVATGGKRRA